MLASCWYSRRLLPAPQLYVYLEQISKKRTRAVVEVAAAPSVTVVPGKTLRVKWSIYVAAREIALRVIGGEPLPNPKHSVTWWWLRARERMEGLYHNMATDYASKGLQICAQRERDEGANMER